MFACITTAASLFFLTESLDEYPGGFFNRSEFHVFGSSSVSFRR